MENVNWHGKPYYSLDAYFKNTFGQKCYKLAVDAGFTCPNRDGSIDNRGCIFCAEGSGAFADTFKAAGCQGAKAVSRSRAFDEIKIRDIVDIQIQNGLERFDKKVGEKYVIYFQSYTNTYGSTEYLRTIYAAALNHEKVIGISIGTRPDCLGKPVLDLLKELKEEYSDKFIWIELGLQTIHEETAKYIRRGYRLSAYEKATASLDAIGIDYITHVILGLPKETKEMMLETVKYVSDIGVSSIEKRLEESEREGLSKGSVDENLSKENATEELADKNASGKAAVIPMRGIKLQLLHVLSGTDLAADYKDGQFQVFQEEEYIDFVIECLKNIDKKIVVHRVTGDGPKSILIAPKWSGNKKHVLNSLHSKMAKQGAFQGQACKKE